MSISGHRKRHSQTSFTSVRELANDDDDDEEQHGKTDAQNLRISLYQIKNIEPILK